MKLNKILMKLGISADKLGFNYIIDIVEILKENKEHTNITNIYKMLSKKENVASKFSVERAIRYSIKQAYKNSNILKKIYNVSPNNSAFLYDLAFNLDVFIDEIGENNG